MTLVLRSTPRRPTYSEPSSPTRLQPTGARTGTLDWKHPTKIDRGHVEELFELGFLTEPANVVLLGPNGVGKSMLAQNLAYESVIRGHATRFCVAADLLNDLSGLEGSVLRTRVKKYVSPKLLVIDEVGYQLSNELANLLGFWKLQRLRIGQRGGEQ